MLVVRAAIMRTSDTTAPLSATFGGVSMTPAVTMTDTSGSNRFYRTTIFYLVNPSTSAGNVVIDASFTVQGAYIAVVTLLGVDTSSPVGVTATDSVASATDNSLALVGCSAESLILAMVESNSALAPSWTWSTATEDFDLAGANDAAEIAGSGAYYAVPSAGNVTLTASRSLSSVRIIGAAAEFKAAPLSSMTLKAIYYAGMMG